MSRRFVSLLPVLALMACLSPFTAVAQGTADPATAQSGTYQIDPNHTSITFKIVHMNFSQYTGRFDKVEGALNYNAAAPEQSTLDVTIYPNSVDTNNVKLEEELRGDRWFDVLKNPRATFHATKIERTGPTTGKITGEFTFMGITHNLALNATLFGTGMNPMLKKPVLGFTATGTFKRSDYGLSNLLPMVGDDVTLQIETEFDKADQ